MGIKSIIKSASGTKVSEKAATSARPSLSALNTRVQAVVTAMAEAEALTAVAKAARAAAVTEAKAIFEESGLVDLEGAEGKVQVIITKGSRRLDPKAVKAILTEEQIEDCTKVGAAGTKVKFTAAKAVLAEAK